jgi:hypothetical protein
MPPAQPALNPAPDGTYAPPNKRSQAGSYAHAVGMQNAPSAYRNNNLHPNPARPTSRFQPNVQCGGQTAGSRTPQLRSPAVPAPTSNNLAQRFNQMTVVGSDGLLDASVAPAPSHTVAMNVAGWQRGPTHAPTKYTNGFSGRNPREWFNNTVCVKSPFRRHHFNKGDVIALPYHVPNMNENTAETDECLRITIHGPVCGSNPAKA